MSRLLDLAPYGPRDETLFLDEMNTLTTHHQEGCPAYARVWPPAGPASSIEHVPFLHVGVFKHITFKTEAAGIVHERVLRSSATTSGTPSRIHLDAKSSRLHARSVKAIFREFLAGEEFTLLILDSVQSLRTAGETTARVAAALSLRPLATDLYFLLDRPEDASSTDWGKLAEVLGTTENVLVFGTTVMLWSVWTDGGLESVRPALAGKRIHFVHSGGWKRLEELRIERSQFERTLLDGVGPDSCVLDFYGLVEQVGTVYPLCEAGYRHAPAWAEVIARDPYTLEPVEEEIGQLQLMNTIALGAPYHSVLTDDLGRAVRGACPCGRSGRRFELRGRVPRSEVRGCANV